MFNATIRSIIDLLKLKKDVKKTELEIDKLADEKQQRGALLKIASLEDIEKYDPRVARLKDDIRRSTRREASGGTAFQRSRSHSQTPQSRSSTLPLLLLAGFLSILGYLVYRWWAG